MPSFLEAALALPLRALSWLGGQGTRAVAAIAFIAVAVPPLGALLRPYVTEAIFLLLCISFTRVDLVALYGHLRRPALVAAATAWTTIGVPLIVALAAHATGLSTSSPSLALALMLQGMASPMMAAPALAALMGLDATLALVTLVTSTALVPFTASLYASLFLGDMLSISPATLGLKLSGILAASLLAATIMRRLVGSDAIQRHKQPIDGLNIIILLVFASAVMGDVATDFLADPLFTIAVAPLAFAVYFTLLALTTLIFRRAGTERAFALGLMASQRNLGLMLAATSGALPATTWLYFALTQFPIHFAPYLLMPIARRLTARSNASCRAKNGDVHSFASHQRSGGTSIQGPGRSLSPQEARDEVCHEQVTAKVMESGYSQVTKLEADDGRWEGEGVKNGQKMEFHADPKTGAIVREKPDE